MFPLLQIFEEEKKNIEIENGVVNVKCLLIN